MEKEKRSGTRTKKKLISKQKFIKAVGTVLRKEGYQKLGVNRVAEVAGVDKSSLYYHFGSFDNLLEQYVLANDYWLGVFQEPINNDGKNLIESGRDMIIKQFEDVMKNEELQAFLLWELSENKGIPKYIAGLREEMGREILHSFNKYFEGSDVDFEMIAAILVSSIYYLVLHRNQSSFCNIDISTSRDQKRLKNLIGKITELLIPRGSEKD
ncbi:MAG: TetR/AcrR family transcriptional regulator [Bacteroidales bacterium]|nr:TetR/AcrR family transcriptional regulator [Bacteroidales bacterium]